MTKTKEEILKELNRKLAIAITVGTGHSFNVFMKDLSKALAQAEQSVIGFHICPKCKRGHHIVQKGDICGDCYIKKMKKTP